MRASLCTGPLTFKAVTNNNLISVIEKYSSEQQYKAKEVISRPGEALGYIYFIKSGRTRHIMTDEDGNEKVLYTLSEGWFFGETTSDLGIDTSLVSIAEVPTTICKISTQRYHELVDTHKDFRDSILQSYAQKLLLLRYELEDLTFTSSRNRLLRLLCSVADLQNTIDGNWYPLKVNYTHYDLGLIIGSSRVTITKIIADLCEAHILRVVNKRMQINKNTVEQFHLTYTNITVSRSKSL